MFYESWGFWLIIGLVIGGCFGFIAAKSNRLDK
jgi:hypothetical protein